MRKPTQIVREFVEKDIKGADKVIILWEKGDSIYMDYSDMEYRDLLYMMTMCKEKATRDMLEGSE